MSFTITRQAVEEEPNSKLMVIGFVSSFMSYLMALQWAGFINLSIEDTNAVILEKSGVQMPKSVSALVSAILFTAIVIGAGSFMYRYVKKVIDEENDEPCDSE